MTLRLALLLVSLVLIGFIGLLCHLKYRQLNPKKRLNNPGNVSEAHALQEEDINAPFISDNIISDIPQSTESLLTPADPETIDSTVTPELKTSHEELNNKKEIAQSIAAELLPVYDTVNFIFEHVAILPNVNKPAAQIQKFFDMQPAHLKDNIDLTATVRNQSQFKPFGSIKAKKKITHLQCEFKLKQNPGMADEAAIKEYEAFIQALSDKLDCEHRFALSTAEVLTACEDLKSFIRDYDLIIILYILAKPDASFNGTDLNTSVTAAGMTFGEFKFFHFYSQAAENLDQKIFSLANMYKPGSFDLNSMDKFTTMGVCAFMVPALINDPLAGFNEMCTCCNRIADDLSGVLTTNKRELLNEENYKHICDQIIRQKAGINGRGVENGSEQAKLIFS